MGYVRHQAEGIARTLGGELSRHVPARSDLEAFRSDIDTQFRSLDTTFTTKFRVLTGGAALTLAFLAVLTELNLFPRVPTEARLPHLT